MRRPTRRRLIGSAVAAGTVGAIGGHWLARSAADTPKPAGSIADAPLFNDKQDPHLGNPLGTLPIAEFFDYRCPFCHRMHPLIARLLQDEPDIRYIAKEWPIFGGVSVTAARVALAANWQGRFAAVNNALFAATGTLTEPRIRTAAADSGVDMVRLDHDLAARDADLQTMLGRVARQAASLGLQGTPGFVIGSILVPGAMTYDNLRKVVAEARARLHPNQRTKHM